jgi:hypothetical protein
MGTQKSSVCEIEVWIRRSQQVIATSDELQAAAVIRCDPL